MSSQDNENIERLKLNVEVWKKIVDVQQHFNDLEMKVRNFGLLIISAFISAIGVNLKSQYEAEIFDYNVPVAAFLACGALVVWILVFFVDVYWYHPLLKGAVLKGVEMEEQLKEQLPNINLTQRIGDESAVSLFGFSNVRSTTKAKTFYLGIAAVLLGITILLVCMGEKVVTDNSADNIVTYIDSPIVPELKENDADKSNLIEGDTEGSSITSSVDEYHKS